MSEEERAEKLAQRFSDNREKPKEEGQSNTSKESKSSKVSKASNTPNATETKDSTEIKDIDTDTKARSNNKDVVRDRKTKLLYLDEDLLDQLEITFDEINLMYKKEYGEELQKNKHYYPKLLEIALKEIENPGNMELEEIEKLLDL